MVKSRRQKQSELYWKQKEMRNMTMLKGNYKQINEMRKKQDETYKKYKFYQGLNNAIERNKDNDNETKTSNKMQGN